MDLVYRKSQKSSYFKFGIEFMHADRFKFLFSFFLLSEIFMTVPQMVGFFCCSQKIRKIWSKKEPRTKIIFTNLFSFCEGRTPISRKIWSGFIFSCQKICHKSWLFPCKKGMLKIELVLVLIFVFLEVLFEISR